MTFDSYDSNQVPTSCIAQLVVTPQFGSPVSCFAQVNVGPCVFDCSGKLNGVSSFDRCGVCEGDGKSCLGCKDFDISATQLGMDGNSAKQNGLIKRATNSLVKAGRRTAQVVKRARAYRAQGATLYQKNWFLSWSISSVVTQCNNSQFCSQSSNISTIDSFNQNSVALDRLLRRVVRDLRRTSRDTRAGARLLVESTTLVNESKKLSDSLPKTSSSCSGA